ncbi:hypothetical protein BSZ35_07075 [Salinibacter sp. 10B]|nr:hypothetical protein BSZ35_07075 [Salinibacter sp. 10B]
MTAVCAGCWKTGSYGTATANQETDQEVPYYYLELSVLDARTVTTVNGVGVDENDGRTSASFNSPMNALLIGTENTVTVTVNPTMVAVGCRARSTIP